MPEAEAKAGAIKAHEKDVYYRRIEADAAALDKPGYSLRQKVALAARILAMEGQRGTVAGQVSAALDDSSFWTQSFGLGFEEAKASNQIRISLDLEVLEGSGRPNPGNRFHSYIYRRRPDVRAIAHTHATYSSALSMLGVPLIPACMETVALWNDVVHLPAWPGVPVGDEEGIIISEAIGDKRAILLANHGLLTVGKTVEEATSLAVIFELAAQLQLLAMPCGEIRPLPEREAAEGYAFASKPSYYERRFNYFARLVLAADPGCLD